MELCKPHQCNLKVNKSCISVSHTSDGISSLHLVCQHIKIILGSDSLQIALSHAVLLVAAKSGASGDVLNAIIEANWSRSTLESSLKMGLIVPVVFLLNFHVQHFIDGHKF